MQATRHQVQNASNAHRQCFNNIATDIHAVTKTSSDSQSSGNNTGHSTSSSADVFPKDRVRNGLPLTEQAENVCDQHSVFPD